jgi:hypothetical protein
MHPIAESLSGWHGGARRTKGLYLHPGSDWKEVQPALKQSPFPTYRATPKHESLPFPIRFC